MSIYSGKPVSIPRPISEIYAKVSDLAQYKDMVEQLPAEQREKLQGVEFRGDAFKMDAPGVGELVFRIVERTPSTHVGLNAEGSPIPLKLSIDLADIDGTSTRLTPRVDIQIPAMLRPFIGGKMQEAADKFGEVFTSLFPAV
ncbi:MAG: SRPBCC family protein [Muribaculaceae bacterium]|nr:SRPBCC family protein [Muribaculaceae bacterium]